jgi:hypothetical protein
MTSSEENKSSLTDLISFLDVGKQAFSIFDNLLKSIEKYRDVTNKNHDRDHNDDLRVCLREIRVRLYKRYNLIEKMSTFAEHGNAHDLDEIKQNLNLHIEYLKNFNNDIPEKIIRDDPKTAAILNQITENSIKLYICFLKKDHVDDARILAGFLVSTMKVIASQLEIIDGIINGYLEKLGENKPKTP